MKYALCVLVGFVAGVVATITVVVTFGSDWGEQEAHDQFLGAVQAHVAREIATRRDRA